MSGPFEFNEEFNEEFNDLRMQNTMLQMHRWWRTSCPSHRSLLASHPSSGVLPSMPSSTLSESMGGSSQNISVLLIEEVEDHAHALVCGGVVNNPLTSRFCAEQNCARKSQKATRWLFRADKLMSEPIGQIKPFCGPA
jgi:predicted nucleic acid-binding Zn ribbon protein